MQAQETPYFSLIIPTKNRVILLQKCLGSIYSQTFKSFEVIIIDDGNVDLHLSVDSNTTIIKNKGIERSAARNTGLELARGKYICFIDDDDLLTENYLMDFYQWHQSNHHDGNTVLRTRFCCIDETGKTIRNDYPYDEHKFSSPLSYLIHRMCGMTTVCIDVQTAKSFKFEESIHLWEDTHFLLRLMEGRRLVQLENINYMYRIHNTMSSMIQEKDQLVDACHHNIGAINHYFENYTSVVLGERDRRYLIAEKLLEYAIQANNKGMFNEGAEWTKASIKNCRSWKFYRLYYNLIKSRIIKAK